MPFDPLAFIQNFNNIRLFIKVAFLILVGLYAIFTFMLATKIRSFNKILFLPANSGGAFLQLVAIIYFFIVLSLFIVTIVIV
ncbi:MAG TPA: DUF5657 family protein [Methylomirabilota bacterium]|nr:DUF5657 family protein [Methylomirabilota bacterium]